MKRGTTLKKKPVRAKRSVKRVAKPTRAGRTPLEKPKGEFIDPLMAAAAQALGLTIDPAWRSGVKFNLELILRLGVLVDNFALPDETEPGPIFYA
jgi:Protein of unknown function (DUF4089)